jgi:hypothetical protein
MMSIESLASRLLPLNFGLLPFVQTDHPDYSLAVRLRGVTNYHDFNSLLNTEDIIYFLDTEAFEHFMPFLVTFATMNPSRLETSSIVDKLIPDPRTSGDQSVASLEALRDRLDSEVCSAVRQLLGDQLATAFDDEREQIDYALKTVWLKSV